MLRAAADDATPRAAIIAARLAATPPSDELMLLAIDAACHAYAIR